jgi:hypothetical protein
VGKVRCRSDKNIDFSQKLRIRIALEVNFETISKIVDYAQGQGENRFKSGAYTLVFEHFESVFNTVIER